MAFRLFRVGSLIMVLFEEGVLTMRKSIIVVLVYIPNPTFIGNVKELVG